MSDPETPYTVAHHTPLSVEFSRQEYWSGWPFPSPGDLPNPDQTRVSRIVGRFLTEPPGINVKILKIIMRSKPVRIRIYDKDEIKLIWKWRLINFTHKKNSWSQLGKQFSPMERLLVDQE